MLGSVVRVHPSPPCLTFMILRKISVSLQNSKAIYHHLDEVSSLNDYVGEFVRIQFLQKKFCLGCQQSFKTLYQGYCFICTKSLAACDLCIVKPERCHFAQGTCREPAWGQTHCFSPHAVYLSITSHLKVGITKMHNLHTRWIHQGAIWALPLGQVTQRLHAGILEVALAKSISDKTQWRALLKGQVIYPEKWPEVIDDFRAQILEHAHKANIPFEPIVTAPTVIDYPILSYLDQINSIDLDVTPLIEDKLIGIKGCYLMFEQSGALNLRKYLGYDVTIDTGAPHDNYSQ
jgi:hypothetical protein